MEYITLFLAGAFLCNCIPHLACGLQGTPFPTPFAKPRGVGSSPPLVNFLWGSFNAFLGVYILAVRLPILSSSLVLLALAAGFLAMGTYLSLHFGKVWREKQATIERTTGNRGP
jgi:hypothetical protein